MAELNIGLFLGSTKENGYESLLLRGAIEGSAEAGVRLVCFEAGFIRGDRNADAMPNLLYSLVDSNHLDGLVFSGAVDHALSAEEMASFCQAYAPLPIVTVVSQIPASPSIVADNKRGMNELMDHLLVHHGCRRIAFLGGPPGQKEAQWRWESYQERLQAHGITPEPNWIRHGDFSRESGRSVVESWLKQDLAAFEALVCASDGMALGAHDAFLRYGLRVPEDLLLTGFDDGEDSRVHLPSLTTVNQNPQLQGREAVRILVEQITGQSVPFVTQVPSSLKIRSSCGCVHRLGKSESQASWNTALEALWEDPHPSQPADSLKSQGFWDAVDRQIQKRFQEGSDPSRLQPELNRLLEVCRQFSEEESDREIRSRLRTEEQNQQIAILSEALSTATTKEKVLEILGEKLPAMGFEGVWVSLFDDPMLPASGMSLQLACEPERRPGVIPGTYVFSPRSFVPGGLSSLAQHHRLLVVQTLYHHSSYLGLVVFSAHPADIRVTGILRIQIGAALASVQQIDERLRTERKLFQNQKMAALGGLVAGVAHEINTPLGVAITAMTVLESRLEGGPQTLDNDTPEVLALVTRSLNKVARLVSRFKEVAADQDSESRSVFRLKAVLKGVEALLSPRWKNLTLTFRLEGPEDLTMDSYPGAIEQVVTQLVLNGLYHAFPSGNPGEVTVRFKKYGALVQLAVEDNGEGISPSVLPRIFEPFFTTKRGQDHTGLGLPVVRNLVEEVLGGTIQCQSSGDQGTLFLLDLPQSAPRKKD